MYSMLCTKWRYFCCLKRIGVGLNIFIVFRYPHHWAHWCVAAYSRYFLSVNESVAGNKVVTLPVSKLGITAIYEKTDCWPWGQPLAQEYCLSNTSFENRYCRYGYCTYASAAHAPLPSRFALGLNPDIYRVKVKEAAALFFTTTPCKQVAFCCSLVVCRSIMAMIIYVN